MSPTPILNAIRQIVGNMRVRKYGVIATPFIMQKTKKIANVSAKFISEHTFLESTKRYFGTFIFEKTSEFDIIEVIPPLAASEKKVKIIFPQKRYIV